ncbi:hypothetical protein HZC09_04095 [Candidatus Micrarchaeota archaeon]|nr:hypothetical protein [Candidatus Micrarchaeota archaeon]
MKAPGDNTPATVARVLKRKMLAALSSQMEWNALKLSKIKAKAGVG